MARSIISRCWCIRSKLLCIVTSMAFASFGRSGRAAPQPSLRPVQYAGSPGQDGRARLPSFPRSSAPLARPAPLPPYDLLQQRQDRIRRERLGDIGAIAVAGRHLSSGKTRDENKRNAAPHQNVRHGIDVTTVDADVEQRGVQSPALDGLERSFQGCDRTDDRPSGSAENRLDQSCDHRLVFDDQHPPGSLTLSSAQRSLARGGPDVRVRLS